MWQKHTKRRFSHERLRSADSVEKVEISDWKASRLAVTSEPVHHAAWFFGSALIFVAWSVG
jgi:hypothetical protein